MGDSRAVTVAKLGWVQSMKGKLPAGNTVGPECGDWVEFDG